MRLVGLIGENGLIVNRRLLSDQSKKSTIWDLVVSERVESLPISIGTGRGIFVGQDQPTRRPGSPFCNQYWVRLKKNARRFCE